MQLPEPRSNLVPGTAVSLAAGVRRIVAPNAGLMTGPGTNTYLLGTREIAVLDPGPLHDEHLHAIMAAAGGAVRWVIVTHTHRDHSPLAQVLAKQTGASLIGLAPPTDGRQDESFRADHSPRDGEALVLGEIALTAIHTPGHASNCVCYLSPAARLLFTGDHVLEGVSPVILPPDGDMTAYLDSLRALLREDLQWLAPGHGFLIERPADAINRLIQHRLKREQKVVDALREGGPGEIATLLAKVYDDVPEIMHPVAQRSLTAHLLKLATEGRTREVEGRWELT